MKEKPPARVPWKHSPDAPAHAQEPPLFPACFCVFFLFIIAPQSEAENSACDLKLAGGSVFKAVINFYDFSPRTALTASTQTHRNKGGILWTS